MVIAAGVLMFDAFVAYRASMDSPFHHFIISTSCSFCGHAIMIVGAVLKYRYAPKRLQGSISTGVHARLPDIEWERLRNDASLPAIGLSSIVIFLVMICPYAHGDDATEYKEALIAFIPMLISISISSSGGTAAHLFMHLIRSIINSWRGPTAC